MTKTPTLSQKLWNIAVNASIKVFNEEWTEEKYLKEVKRFEKILNAAIKK